MPEADLQPTEAEQRREEAITKDDQINQTLAHIQRNFWMLASLLREFKEQQFYETLGYDTMTEYLQDPDIPIGYKQGLGLIRLHRRFKPKILDGDGVSLRDVQEMGVDKATRISQFHDKPSFDEWVEKAKRLPESDLKLEIREAKDDGEPTRLDETETGEAEPYTVNGEVVVGWIATIHRRIEHGIDSEDEFLDWLRDHIQGLR